MKTIILASFVLALTYLWQGMIYESDYPVIVLDGQVREVIKNGEKTWYRPIKGTKFDGTCPNCRVYTEKKLAVLIEPSEGPK